VCLGHHLERLPEELRESYVGEVARRCGQPVELDYVRLNILARCPESYPPLCSRPYTVRSPWLRAS